MTYSSISRRKSEHLRIVLEEKVLHRDGTLLDNIRLLHHALPELSIDQIDCSTEFFGRALKAPLMITSMTGGSAATKEMNRDLAAAAAKTGIAFSVGSQRIMLERPRRVVDFAVRKQIPNGVLLGNIGAVQLPEYPIEAIVGLVEMIEADGICVHLNPAQELAQPEGNRSFVKLQAAIARLVDRLEGKVLVKETGAGMSPQTLEKLRASGVQYIDVAGSGGTSWTKVEMFRTPEGAQERQIGETFSDWGIPTAFSVLAARRVCPSSTCIIGSGGVQNGLDCARVIAAGAQIAGFARAVLMAWNAGGREGAIRYIDRLQHELRVAMLLCGAVNLPALQAAPRIYIGELRQWLESNGWLDVL
jgi:isopentenyl-diphosphate delta-isomerase